MLGRFYGLYATLEPALAPMAARLLTDWEERRKLHLLERDLLALGLSPAEIAGLPCAPPPAHPTPAAAAGALYVLEGSTLGGQLIWRQLGRLGVQERAASFFRAYGPEVGPMWKRFGRQLAAATLDEGVAVEAARGTFDHFAAWFAASAARPPAAQEAAP